MSFISRYSGKQKKIRALYNWLRLGVTALTVVSTAVIVFFLLFYGNIGALWLVPQLNQKPAGPYQHQNILFERSNCQYCTKIDVFLSTHLVQKNFPLVRLDVSLATNKSVIIDKAQACGIDTQKIGVPFLWVDKSQKCFIGYPDIITFLQANMTPKM